MNAQNPALIIRGPAIVSYKGKVFYSKANISLLAVVTTFGIDSSAYGVAENREATSIMRTSFTPVGKIDDGIAVLYPHRTYVPGQLVHHTKTMGAINLATNVITCTAHGFDDGAGVRVTSWGTLPAGLAAATKYFLHSLSANTFTLHPTRADALANTNAIDITDAGTGLHRIIEQEELVIQSISDGQTTTFHNACITKMPQFFGGATKTAFGDVEYTFYRKHGADPTDANALYTIAAGAFTDTSFDPADILTEPYELGWGSVAPWVAMGTREGAVFEPTMSLSERIDDAIGIVSHQIDSIEASVTARPNNVTDSDVLAKRVLQDAGAGRGRRITGDDLNIIGTEAYIRLYAASIEDVPLNFDGKEDRVGDIKWRANRSVTAGVANPLFYIGAAAPA